jgi:hypothetical protein
MLPDVALAGATSGHDETHYTVQGGKANHLKGAGYEWCPKSMMAATVT